jgi:hypothetical protein
LSHTNNVINVASSLAIKHTVLPYAAAMTVCFNDCDIFVKRQKSFDRRDDGPAMGANQSWHYLLVGRKEQINTQDHILCSHQSITLKCIGTKQESVNARK